MVPYRVAPRVAKLWFVVLPLSMIAACSSGPGPQISKKPAEIELPKETFGPPTLEKIEKALAKYEWGPAHDACDKDCGDPSDVTIRSIGKTKDIKGDSGPARRRIVALIQNYSAVEVLHEPSKWTFRPKTKYLMWVHSKGNKATWGFIELGDRYSASPVEIGRLMNCEPPHEGPRSDRDDANFQDCKAPPPDSNASTGLITRAYAAPARTKSPAQSLPSITGPGWIGCDPDCCTGTTTQVIATLQQNR